MSRARAVLLATALVVALLILSLFVDDSCDCDAVVDSGPVPTSSSTTVAPSTTTTVQDVTSTTSTTQVESTTTTTEPSTLERTG